MEQATFTTTQHQQMTPPPVSRLPVLLHQQPPQSPQLLNKTPISRIPIRTANAEKRARANDMLPPEYDESKLSPSEIRALRAQKRAAWRQARLKSLENDALQAQIMIQTMNAATLHDEAHHDPAANPTVLHLRMDPEPYPTIIEQQVGGSSSDEQVETMREKIIMLELEEPSSGSSEQQQQQKLLLLQEQQETVQQQDPAGKDQSSDHDDSTEAADVSLEDDDAATGDQPDSIVLRMDPSNPHLLEHLEEFEGESIEVQQTEIKPLQTIVEVVNPALTGGDCQINDIIVGRYNDDCAEDSFASASSPSTYGARLSYEEGRYESINDKMKNVLRELKQNEKVRLNLSKSLTEEELAEQEGDYEEEDEEEAAEERYERQEEFPDLEEDEEDEEFRHYEEKTGAIGTVFMVRERLINDFYTHQSELAQEHQQQQQTHQPPLLPPTTQQQPLHQTPQSEDDFFDDCEVIHNPNAQAFEEEFEKLHTLTKLQKLTLNDEKLKAVFCEDEDEEDDEEGAGSSLAESIPERKGSGAALEEKPSGIPIAGTNGNGSSKRKKRKSKKKK